MIPNPIRRVLSSIREHRARALLMGGQACVLYGAAEFSRGTDLVILADVGNLTRLRRALAELQAEVIAVPPFQIRHLLLQYAMRGDPVVLEAALREEEDRERDADRRYWQPLRTELERLRQRRVRGA